MQNEIRNAYAIIIPAGDAGRVIVDFYLGDDCVASAYAATLDEGQCVARDFTQYHEPPHAGYNKKFFHPIRH